MNDPEKNVAALERIYANRFSEDSPERLAWRRELWQVLTAGFFSRWIPPDGTVLDFGCGRGEFINAVRARRRIGVDLRDSVARHLAPDVELVLAADDWTSRLGAKSVDVVFCSNLLEHLPSRAAISALFEDFHRILQPSGRLLILGPNLRYTHAAYWDFFDHIIPLTHLSLAEALVSSGFALEVLLPRFLPYTTVGKRTLPLAWVRWYLRWPIAWKLFGAQFFAVAHPAPQDLTADLG